jgi:hypothetical protein
MYFIQHCFICSPSDSIMSEDAGIEPRKVATSEMAVRRSNQSARSCSSDGWANKKICVQVCLLYCTHTYFFKQTIDLFFY